MQPPSRAPRTRRAGSTGRRLTGTVDQRAISALTVLAAAIAVPEAPAVSGWGASDALYGAGAAALLVQAASRSRRWSWIYLAGATTAVAPSLVLGAPGLLALAIAFWSAATDQRRRVIGAVLGMLCSIVLMRLELADPAGASALVVAAIAFPVLVSGWRVAPQRVRRPMLRGAVVVVGASILVGAAFGVAVLLASQDVTDALSAAEVGLDAARDGDTTGAALALRRSEDRFDHAHGLLDGWLARPAHALPIVGVNARALSTSTDAGAELVAAAARTAEEVDLAALSVDAGSVDLEVLASFAPPMHAAADAVLHAQGSITDLDRELLLPQVRDRVEELEGRLREVAPEAVLAADVVDVAPALLGGEGTRRYFVAFVQPAEARSGGGFMGNWAELTATDGQLEMTRHGRVTELRDQPGAEERVLRAPADYVARYGRFNPQYWVQDVTMSPDFPTVAEVLRTVYPDAGGAAIDGVLQLDPYALAALLEFTGPIEIEGYPRRLTKSNAAKILLEDQYLEFSERSARADFLGEASTVAFDELLAAPLPSPRAAATVLDPVVDAGRLKFWSFHAPEQDVLRSVGIDGAMPPPDGHDFVAVRHQNNANNKIDIFLERTLRYEVTVEPDSGALSATAQVTLENRAPSEGLPDAVIGDNDKGLPLGTNQMLLSLYSPHRLVAATVDGEPVSAASERELGYHVYTLLVQVPAGERVDVAFDLKGRVAAGADYSLTLAPQGLVRAERVSVQVGGAAGWALRSEDLFGMLEGGDERVAGLLLDTTTVLSGSWRHRDGG